MKTSIKKRAAAKLISSHENIEQQPHYSPAMNQKIETIASSKNAFQNMGGFFKIAPSKNTFQNMGELRNCSLKKYISEHAWFFFLKKNAPSKNTFQNMGDF